MTLYIVRHGRTTANAAGELLGRRDPELDDLGRQQAALLAQAIVRRVGERRVTVVSSPLRRASATAEAIASALPSPTDVVIDARWIELDYGELEGTLVADVDRATWRRWRSDPAFAPPGGETLVGLRARVALALHDAFERMAAEPGVDVIVASHVSPIKAAVTEVLGVGDDVTWKLFLAPASITEVVVRAGSPGGAVLAGFNETAHLDPR